MLHQLRQWFAARSAQEQRALRIGAIAGLVILALAILVPLHRGVAATSLRVATLRDDLTWLRSRAAQLTAAASVPAASHESLVVLVDRAARATGIAAGLTSSQPTANGGLDVHLDHVSFDALATWLGQLVQLNGVRVETATIENAGAPGQVRAVLTLRLR